MIDDMRSSKNKNLCEFNDEFNVEKQKSPQSKFSFESSNFQYHTSGLALINIAKKTFHKNAHVHLGWLQIPDDDDKNTLMAHCSEADGLRWLLDPPFAWLLLLFRLSTFRPTAISAPEMCRDATFQFFMHISAIEPRAGWARLPFDGSFNL